MAVVVQELMDAGCSEAAASAVVANIERLRAAPLGTAETTVKPEDKVWDLVVAHFQRLCWPTDWQMEVEAQYDINAGMEPRMGRERRYWFADGYAGDAFHYAIETNECAQACELARDELVSLWEERGLKVLQAPTDTATWEMTGDTVTSKYTSDGITSPGYAHNPFAPLIKVFEAGYFMDPWAWRFTNAAGDHLGELPPLPTDAEPYYERSGGAVRAQDFWSIFFFILFLPHYLVVLISPALMGLMVGIAIVVGIAALITQAWWLLLVAAYVWAGAKWQQAQFERAAGYR